MIDTIYHVGHLAFDREQDIELGAEANRLYALAREGKMILYQRRAVATPCPGFEYHARPIRGAL